ncbi:MAG: adenylate kinase [Candidatus Hydrogenedentes bacterium]|nr:adenylate kinase [Candidatus Hydrogenedentota bacterium]
MEIVLLGPPGSGKGTQAKRIARARKLAHISTGDILRSHIEKGTDLGEQARPYMERGLLVPDELVCAIVARRTVEPDCVQGYLLDGFPRSLNQAKVLQELLSKSDGSLDVAINLDVADSELVERLTARRSCPRCGAIYNMKFNPPSRIPYCDVEGDENIVLMQRPDDKEETVMERLRVYHETAAPILEYYEAQGLLRPVRGTHLGSDGVYAKVEEILAVIETERPV